jgi:hypothetical protein
VKQVNYFATRLTNVVDLDFGGAIVPFMKTAESQVKWADPRISRA